MLGPTLSLLLATTGTSTAVVVELITMGPGPELYSYWGHAALRVIDPRDKSDRVYNFGSVDFSDGFFVRMLRGQVDAFVGVSSYPRTEEAYVGEDRTFERRTLGLTASAALDLSDALRQNHGPKATYRYHHFLDNCSTRVATLLDRASGGRLRDDRPESPSATFRARALAQLAPHPFTAAAVDLCLAHGVDRPISRFEATFLPDALAAQLDERPGLVSTRTQVHQAPPIRPLHPWWVIAGCVSLPWLLLAAFRPRAALMIYGIGAGVLGTALLVLWLGTTYDFVARNLNLLVLPPTHLAWPFLRPERQRAYASLHLVILLGLLALSAAGALSQDVRGPLSLGLALTGGAWARLRWDRNRVSTSPE